MLPGTRLNINSLFGVIHQTSIQKGGGECEPMWTEGGSDVNRTSTSEGYTTIHH